MKKNIVKPAGWSTAIDQRFFVTQTVVGPKYMCKHCGETMFGMLWEHCSLCVAYKAFLSKDDEDVDDDDGDL